jgi:hypothetical protein
VLVSGTGVSGFEGVVALLVGGVVVGVVGAPDDLPGAAYAATAETTPMRATAPPASQRVVLEMRRRPESRFVAGGAISILSTSWMRMHPRLPTVAASTPAG